MQCPNCGREAININGREICLDCGIEIARGVYDAKNELPKEQEETATLSPQQTGAISSDLANAYETDTAAPVAAVDTPNIGSTGLASEPIGFHAQDPSTASREYSVPSISHLGGSQENEAVPESVLREGQANTEDGEPTVDRLVMDSIEKKENISPHIESPADLIFDFQKNDNAGAIEKDGGVMGATSEVEEEAIDTREAAEKQSETPIFEDQISGENEEVSEPASLNSTLNEEILVNESYVEPKDALFRAVPQQEVGGTLAENPSQVDSIKYGAPAPHVDYISNLSVGQVQNNYSDQTVDIMPAQGVSSGTYRKIAIVMIVLINIIAIASLGIFVKNKYFGGKDAETVQLEPAVTVE